RRAQQEDADTGAEGVRDRVAELGIAPWRGGLRQFGARAQEPEQEKEPDNRGPVSLPARERAEPPQPGIGDEMLRLVPEAEARHLVAREKRHDDYGEGAEPECDGRNRPKRSDQWVHAGLIPPVRTVATLQRC